MALRCLVVARLRYRLREHHQFLAATRAIKQTLQAMLVRLQN